ncbi:MAG TPA: hypothetical protein VF142_00120 [Longimicrobium sp.]
MTMPRLRIDIHDLTTALTDHDSLWVLDLQTGQVLMEAWVRDPGPRDDLELDLSAECAASAGAGIVQRANAWDDARAV